MRVISVDRWVVEVDRPLLTGPHGWTRLWESPGPGGPRVQVGRLWSSRVLTLWIWQRDRAPSNGNGDHGR